MLYVTLKLFYMIMDVIIRLRNYNRTVNILFNIFIFSSTHFTLFTLITATVTSLKHSVSYAVTGHWPCSRFQNKLSSSHYIMNALHLVTNTSFAITQQFFVSLLNV